MSQGLKLAGEGNNKGAAVVFKNLLEKYPGDEAASLALAEAYLNTGKSPMALAEAEKVLAQKPDSEKALLVTAKVKLLDRKPQESMAILDKVLSRPQASTEAWELSGQARFFVKDYQAALESFRKATEVSPANVKARAGLVECSLELGNPQQAQQEVEELLKVSPKDKAGLYLQAQLQTQREEEEALIATYAAIGKYYPNELRARFAEAYLRLTKKNDVEFARKLAARLTETYKNAPEGYKLDGLVLQTTGQNQQSLDPLLKALRLRQDIDTELYLAQSYSALGMDETAINHLQSVITRAPELLVARRMLASIYLKQKRLDEAIEEANRIFQSNPTDPKSRAIMADALVSKREFDKGLAIFEEIAKEESSNPTLYMKKGMLLTMRGKDDEAEKDLRKAVSLGGNSLEPRLYLSSFLAGKNRVDEAVEALQGGKQEGPESALALNAMAKLRLRQGNVVQAFQLLEQAKTADKSLLMTYYNLAAMNIATGKPEEAARQFDEALLVDPADLRSLLGAAAAREAKNEFPQAQALYERASATGYVQGAMALAEYYIRRDDKAKAIHILDECLSKAPDTAGAWLLKSRLHANLGEHDKALAALSRVETINQPLGLRERAKYYLAVRDKTKAMEAATRLRDINPRSAEYSIPLSEIQDMTGDHASAKQTLANALREDPKNHNAMVMLSNMEARDQRYPEALALLDRAGLAGMNPSAVCAYKGIIRQRAGEVEEAAKEYLMSLRHEERNIMALNNLAMIYADRNGSSNDALDLAMRAYSVEPHNAAVLDTLGYALLKNGRVKEARAALREASKLQPDNGDIAKHLELALSANETPRQ